MAFNRDVFGEDEFLSSYVSDRPHCSTNDCDTTTETEDVSIHSSASSTSIGIENALDFLSISAATIAPETVSPLPQCTYNKGRNPPVQGKKEKIKFNRHTNERSYCGRKNAYRKKGKGS